MIHRLKSELLLEKCINVEKRDCIVLQFHNWVVSRGIYNGWYSAAILLKLLDLVNNFGKPGQNEFFALLLYVVNDILEHLHNHFVWYYLSSLNYLLKFKANGSLPLILIPYKLFNIKCHKTMFVHQFLSHFFLKFYVVSAWPNVDDQWLNMLVDFLHSLLKVLVCVNHLKIGVLLQNGDNLSGMLMELFHFLCE